jgi:hypothetical protein
MTMPHATAIQRNAHVTTRRDHSERGADGRDDVEDVGRRLG